MPHNPPPYEGPPNLRKTLVAGSVPLLDLGQVMSESPGSIVFIAIEGFDVVGGHGLTQYRQLKNVSVNKDDDGSFPTVIELWDGPDIRIDGTAEVSIILMGPAEA
jgi:hypothetical protein